MRLYEGCNVIHLHGDIAFCPDGQARLGSRAAHGLRTQADLAIHCDPGCIRPVVLRNFSQCKCACLDPLYWCLVRLLRGSVRARTADRRGPRHTIYDAKQYFKSMNICFLCDMAKP